MPKYVLIIFFLVYFFSIAQKIHCYKEVCHCLKRLKKFICAYEHGFLGHSNSHKYSKELNSLLQYSPVIRKYYNGHAYRLSYNNPSYTNEEHSKNLYIEFLDIKVQKLYELKCSFNPIYAVRKTCLLPVTILNWFGIRPNKIAGVIISIISCAGVTFFEFLLNTYSKEITTAINTFIRTVVG